jgi:hypothetical protein
MQQPMCIERIVDPAFIIQVEDEPHLLSSFAEDLASVCELLCGRAILLADMLRQILPAGRHVRVEFKRLKLDFDQHFQAYAVQGREK